MDKTERVNELLRLINLYMKDYVDLVEKLNKNEINYNDFLDYQKSLRDKFFDLISDLL